jgi:hypothetical protein
MDAPAAFVIVISAGCACRAMRFNLRGVDRICSSCRQIDPVDGSPSAQEKSSAVFFFFLVTSLSVFFSGQEITSSLVLSCITSAVFFVAQRTQHVIVTVSPQLQPAKTPPDEIAAAKKKKNPTCIPPSRDPISSSAGRDAATRPRPAPESRHRRRGRPGQISTSQERENGLVRLLFSPSHVPPLQSKFPRR